MPNATRKWIVGLDLSQRSRGAASFARALAEHGGDALFGVHVLEEAHLQAALRYHHLAELEQSALTTMNAYLADLGSTAAFRTAEVIEGRTAEETLAAAAEYRACDGIVIGRNAARDGTALVRLGRVARRLLRTLPRPIAVVPPDFDAAATGKGPIVLASGLEEDSTRVVAAARELAERFARPLHVVHVGSAPAHHSAQYLPETTLARLRSEAEESGAAALAAWATAAGIADATKVVRLGTIVPTVLEYANEHDAFMIVTGSRRLTGFERLLIASSGSELAGHARCPVLVVPPQ